MAKAVSVLVCILILAIDVTAGILGIEAESAQNKAKRLRVFFLECKQPVHQAYRLGLAAAILLGIAHVISNMIGGCVWTCSKEEFGRSSTNRRLATGTLILSWIILLVGFTMLLTGALSNRKTRVTCGIEHHKFLSIGGILCSVHRILCVAYYAFATGAGWEAEGERGREVGV